MYTPANHDLVWRGVASKSLDPKANPDFETSVDLTFLIRDDDDPKHASFMQ